MVKLSEGSFRTKVETRNGGGKPTPLSLGSRWPIKMLSSQFEVDYRGGQEH